MLDKIYTFQLVLDFKLMNRLSGIDRYDSSWGVIEKREGYQTLKELKSIATVYSVGASTRIEGSRMTNDEVKVLLFDNIKQSKFEERDQQEVIGYFNTLDIISESYRDIEITESSIQNLHNILLKYSEKDQWHKGKYKQHSNSVDATHADGSKTTIFKTTEPGFATEDAMRSLIKWYNEETITPPVIKAAVFVYDFLSIHPFQDGNGRLSRLLGTLLLLKNGYSWVQYISFEHEIEGRKAEYYQILMDCQKQRPNENIYPWINFFLDCLGNIQSKLTKKLEVQKSENQLSPREKLIYTFIDNHPGCKSSEVSKKLNIPLPTVKRILSEMVNGRFLTKYGIGAGTNYTTEKLKQIKNNIAMLLTEKEYKKEFVFENRHSFIEIKKIILTPKFEWTTTNDWHNELTTQGLMLQIHCYNNKGVIKSDLWSIESFIDPEHKEPKITLLNPINIPRSIWGNIPNDNEFQIKTTIELTKTSSNLKFDVILVHDSNLE